MGGKACFFALWVYAAAAALVDVAECVGNMLPSALGADEHVPGVATRAIGPCRAPQDGPCILCKGW